MPILHGKSRSSKSFAIRNMHSFCVRIGLHLFELPTVTSRQSSTLHFHRILCLPYSHSSDIVPREQTMRPPIIPNTSSSPIVGSQEDANWAHYQVLRALDSLGIRVVPRCATFCPHRFHLFSLFRDCPPQSCQQKLATRSSVSATAVLWIRYLDCPTDLLSFFLLLAVILHHTF